MADSGRYIWKWSKKKIERKKKKEKIKYPKSKKKTLGKWSALLISESIERKTERTNESIERKTRYGRI